MVSRFAPGRTGNPVDQNDRPQLRQEGTQWRCWSANASAFGDTKEAAMEQWKWNLYWWRRGVREQDLYRSAIAMGIIDHIRFHYGPQQGHSTRRKP